MDKKEDFAERRRRQKEKLSLQRAERRKPDSMPTQTALTKHSKPSEVPRADSPGSSENTDDAYVHVDKADAAEADTAPAQPSQSPRNITGAEEAAAGSSTVTKPGLSPAKPPARQPAIFPSAVSPASKTAEAMGKLQVSADAEPKQAQRKPLTAPSSVSEAIPQAAFQSPSQEQSAAPAVQRSPRAEELSLQAGRDVLERPQPAKAAVSKGAARDMQSPEQKQHVHDAAPEEGSSQINASSNAPTQAVAAARPDSKAMGGLDAEKAGEPTGLSGSADKQAAGAASSGSWGWGKGWLPTAALQQVAAGAMKDVQEMKESLQQVFAAEDAETTTDEDEAVAEAQRGTAVFAAEDPEATTDEDEAMPEAAPEAQRGAPAGASEVERRAVLERLQGQDNHLAAGFKLLDRQIDSVLGGAAGLAGSLLGRAHSAGRQVAGKVEAGLELFGKSAIGLLDGGMDYSGLPPNNFASHFRHNGGSDLAESVEELCNNQARLCNRLRSVLKGAELEAFNADVEGMAAYLDTASLAGAAVDEKELPCPAKVPDIDTIIVRAACKRGAERLEAWHGRKPDAFALWGLHDGACGELAEAAAECVGALDTFGIELSGSAAAKVGAQLAPGTFHTIADYLKSKVRAMVAALSLLADTYQAIADKAAAEALAAFEAEKRSASSKPEGKAEEGSSSSASKDSSQPNSGVKQVKRERYPDHVHDPLKVQLELRNVKAAALQTVTELYRGLLYVILAHCHARRLV